MRWRTRVAVSVFVAQMGVRITFTSARLTESGALSADVWAGPKSRSVCSHCWACLGLRQPGRLEAIRASAQSRNVGVAVGTPARSGTTVAGSPPLVRDVRMSLARARAPASDRPVDAPKANLSHLAVTGVPEDPGSRASVPHTQVKPGPVGVETWRQGINLAG